MNLTVALPDIIIRLCRRLFIIFSANMAIHFYYRTPEDFFNISNWVRKGNTLLCHGAIKMAKRSLNPPFYKKHFLLCLITSNLSSYRSLISTINKSVIN